MYHILIALSLIVAQNYIDKNNVKQAILEKYEKNLQNPATDFAHQQQPESEETSEKKEFETKEIENLDEIIDIAQGEDITEVPEVPAAEIKEKVKKLEQKVTESDLKNIEETKIAQNIDEKALDEVKKPTSDFESAQNLLDNLRKKEEAKQKELDKLANEDLESLGLDIVDEDFANIPKKTNNDFAAIPNKKEKKKTQEKEAVIAKNDKENKAVAEKESTNQDLEKKIDIVENKEEKPLNEEKSVEIVQKEEIKTSQEVKKAEISDEKDQTETKKAQLEEKSEEKTANQETQIAKDEKPLEAIPDVGKMIAQEKEKENIPLSEEQLKEFSNLTPKLPSTKNDEEVKTVKKEENEEEKDVVHSLTDSLISVRDKIAKSFIKEEYQEDKTDDAVQNIANLSKEEQAKKIQKTQENLKKTKELAKKEAEKKAKEAREKRKIAAQKLRKKRENAILKAREKSKRLMLAKLRSEYIDDFRNNVILKDTENFGIPEKKILPRFIVYSLPPELLDRNKSIENRHNPEIITPVEYANFMFESIASNRMDDFRSLFSVIRNPDIMNTKGDTILIFAILMQRYEAIAFLLANGANPNLENKLGYTPLNVAIEMADYISVELLLALGADINYVDDFGENYLMQSARVGYYPVVDLLIEKGISVNKSDLAGFSAIDVAIKNNDKILTKYFKKLGANKNNIEYQRRRLTLIEQLQNRWR